ncbi:MAG: universal stress protein, partial [Anaerolineaceae bacterium]|nr:universal stress protein [Anaerolineaceae bacterium]
DPARKIVDRSKWTDIIVANFTTSPMSEISAKSKAARQSMLRHSGRPLLAACETPSQLKKPLLAFDGSPKAKEALYVAAYLAKKHGLPLVVASAASNDQLASSIQYEARKYLSSHQIKATYIVEKEDPVEVIQKTADTFQCDFIIMGSYGFQPLIEMVAGSTVDRLIIKGDLPILICR